MGQDFHFICEAVKACSLCHKNTYMNPNHHPFKINTTPTFPPCQSNRTIGNAARAHNSVFDFSSREAGVCLMIETKKSFPDLMPAGCFLAPPPWAPAWPYPPPKKAPEKPVFVSQMRKEKAWRMAEKKGEGQKIPEEGKEFVVWRYGNDRFGPKMREDERVRQRKTRRRSVGSESESDGDPICEERK